MSPSELEATIKNPDFTRFAESAHEDRKGYAVRINSLTGKKELFITGTRKYSIGDQALNVWDTGIALVDSHWHKFGKIGYSVKAVKMAGMNPVTVFDPYRRKHTSRIQDVVDYEDIDVVYGHSRGGAIAADLHGDIEKIGLDAAMIETVNKKLYNLHEDTKFDNFLAYSGENNHHYNVGPKWHFVWK